MVSENDRDAIVVVAIVLGVVAVIAVYYFYRKRQTKEAEKSLLEGSDDTVTVSAGTKTKERPSYKIKKRLGDGAYGSVFLAVRRTDHQMIALKVIPCKDEREAKESMKEYTMCMEVQGHNGIVKVFDVFFDSPVDDDTATDASYGTNASVQGGNTSLLKDLQIRCPAAAKYLCIVSEYCEEGTLFDLLITIRNANSRGRREHKSSAGLDEPIVWEYTQQLLDAIAYLHSKSLMHRDLKPSNVLLGDNHRRMLLTDFGLSRFVEADEYAQTRTGTLQYMSPEQVQRRYNNKGDVWGIGCLVHAMCTARVSTAEARIMFRDRIKPNFQSVMRQEEMSGYSQELIDFMLLLLSYRYQERPSAQEAADLCRKKIEARRNGV
ncbi:protein kinase, putative [Bodo saltans]|uniref:non-specific serine/threonine protein kinase n=1 Tax=Bodo saltans TaxID=75058 RepID=A0A0S4IVE6_BODSA|nr:protein kinase, putative [Bodo saltans]|eukprot:CUF86702.1 protein kinase, putative [Bodo saltans]